MLELVDQLVVRGGRVEQLEGEVAPDELAPHPHGVADVKGAGRDRAGDGLAAALHIEADRACVELAIVPSTANHAPSTATAT